ncbi:putative acetylglutamate synthase [Phaeomoniella chlamydospora]|uniref:Amino-acid acetyltransferase, mitochondrial n=1 Tax=Phaeomoniella chlamydospora TaxID=158046 RepID=A0A0G2E499_PHACM|nr:putative acetylglutamate synthase [Phaeomoniella chlamydospora]
MEFFFDLLNSAATKRDAKAYISRLKSTKRVEKPAIPSHQPVEQNRHISPPSHGVNLGGFFGHSRAVENTPVFKQYEHLDLDIQHAGTVHVALVKVAVPQDLKDPTVEGIAQTLSQLARLSMVPCVVVDTRPQIGTAFHEVRAEGARQANRLVDAIEKFRGSRASKVDSVMSLSDNNICKVFSRELLLRPLREGRIPVILPIAHTESTQRATVVSADDVMLALTKELAGLTINHQADEHPGRLAVKYQALQKQISVDRVILLDPCGAVISSGPQGRAHVFVNLEQEFEDIAKELSESNSKDIGETRIHLKNLQLLRSILTLLPPASSAIITTPEEASRSSRISRQAAQVSSVGTRRKRNPLIHNLLTDKPAQSSSLPRARLGPISESTEIVTSTFVKKGMPLTMLPDPRTTPWTPHGPRINLHDPRIDLPRLVHLIEDSFNRTLDLEHYLNRVNNRIAGLIIAGNYEGGAILTWETPPGVSPTDLSRQVPYLDKFAVLKRSQGAGGVADIVFNAMVRGCFPNGVCWRSRRTNPVNKWYFERARGTWKIPETEWTMFWTTKGVEDNIVSSRDDGHANKTDLFTDYEGVCRNVEPSWKDGKADD